MHLLWELRGPLSVWKIAVFHRSSLRCFSAHFDSRTIREAHTWDFRRRAWEASCPKYTVFCRFHREIGLKSLYLLQIVAVLICFLCSFNFLKSQVCQLSRFLHFLSLFSTFFDAFLLDEHIPWPQVDSIGSSAVDFFRTIFWGIIFLYFELAHLILPIHFQMRTASGSKWHFSVLNHGQLQKDFDKH